MPRTEYNGRLVRLSDPLAVPEIVVPRRFDTPLNPPPPRPPRPAGRPPRPPADAPPPAPLRPEDDAGDGPEPLLVEAEGVMRDLCRGLNRVFESLPTTISRPADVKRALRVDDPLASRLWRIASVAHPIDAVEFLPTINQLRRAVKAAQRAGAGEGPSLRAMEAVEALDVFMRTHTGDLGQFEALTSRGAADAGEALRLRHRRAAFKTNSQVWEMHARTAVVCSIFHEGATAHSEHAEVIKGYAGLQVLRPNRRLEVQTSVWYYTPDPQGHEPSEHAHHPLPPALMEDFVEGPLPRMVSTPGRHGGLDTHISLPALDRSAAATFYTEQVVPDTNTLAEPDPAWKLQALVRLPSELLHLDLWIPSGWSDPATFSERTFGCLCAPERARECREADHIEVHSDVQTFLNVRGDEPPAAPEVARWSEAIASATARLGLSERRFDVYRCRVKFPVLHSVVGLMVKAKTKG